MKAQEHPPPDFSCPYRHACPHLGGLSTSWVQLRHDSVEGSECHYESVIQQLHEELAQVQQQNRRQEQEIAELKAQIHALHRRQFKGRRNSSAPPEPAEPAASRKKRGAPQGHPGWTRPEPKQIDQWVDVPAPTECPHCQCTQLTSVPEVREHLQEDIVLEPRVRTTCFTHHLAHCPECDRDVLIAGPGELRGSYIGPAAKATALYLRYQLQLL
jgi:transposase